MASRTLTLGFVSLALGLPPLARGGDALPGTEPDEASCAAMVARTDPLLSAQRAAWSANTAPGSNLAPAPDAERTWVALDGWVKVPVAERARAAAAPLPDPWPRPSRRYQRAWYVLRADFGPAPAETLWLRFDAVAHQCEAFVNGVHVGHHLGGFTPFSFDITRAVHPGINTIALYVRDEHAVESADGRTAYSQLGVTQVGKYLSPAGICGGVYFDARPAVHADHLLIHTSTRRNEIEVTTWLGAPAPAGATLEQAVYAWPDGPSPVLRLPPASIGPGQTSARVSLPWADARRWSPEHPNLYILRTRVAAGGKSETVETRFGFREFWTQGRSFILNGTPTRLLGVSLAHDLDLTIAGNPACGRLYARDVLAFDKRELNYRAMRLHASIHPPEAIQAADEIGLLCIDQSSIWSAMGSAYARDPDEFLHHTRPQFAEWFWRDANDPSVVIWDVENEMIRGPATRTPARERWVLALDGFIQDLDPTRVVEHSGAAWYAPTQQDIHVHMQNQYSHVLADWAARGRAPLIIGEFWVGGRNGSKHLPDGREYTGRRDWNVDENRIYRESILEMRNYGASGVMPFWLDDVILGRTRDRLWRSYDPAKDRIFFWRYPGLKDIGAEALAPVVAFAWPRSQSVEAGGALRKEIVVCNDLEERAAFTVTCSYGGRSRTWPVTLDPAAQDRHPVSFPAAGSGDLVVAITGADGRTWSGDTLSIHAIAPEREAPPPLSRELVVEPAPPPAVAAALARLGLPYRTAAQIPADARHTILLVPPDAAGDALGRGPGGVRRYLESGGRLLALAQHQDPAWLPIDLPFSPSATKSFPEFNLLGWPEYTRYLDYSRDIPLYGWGHPAFAGLDPRDFANWNAGDGRVADDVFQRPGADGMRAGAPYRVLAGDGLRPDASLVEVSVGDGTAILCQAQALGQADDPGARALLMNLLRYLDGPAWSTSNQRVGLAGNLTAARLAALVDLPAGSFVAASRAADAPRIVLAGDGADVGLLDDLARSGRTVVVLSRETAGRLPGYAVSSQTGWLYAGTRGGAADDPLFWGFATGSFLPLEESPAKGAFRHIPSGARILLGGLSADFEDGPPKLPGKGHWLPIDMLDADGPVAVAEARGSGRLIATTLEPWNSSAECDRQLLATLLANAGVRLGADAAGPGAVTVKLTVPPRIDGRLDDWTNDLVDLNVSPYTHAQPIALSRHDVASGWVPEDTDLSAVVYLLHDDRRLYLAGIVFSEEPAVKVDVELDRRTVTFDLGRRSMTLDGRAVENGRVAFGRCPAHEVFDTRLLSLRPGTPGRTFEAAIPWRTLGYGTAEPAAIAGRVRVSREGGTLEVPDLVGGKEPEPLSLLIAK